MYPKKTKKALISWINDSTRKRISIEGDLIKEKAKQYFNQLKDLEPSSSSFHFQNLKFSASNGWLTGFLRRQALHNVKVQGEAASADETAAKNYCKVLAKIIDDGGYCPDQVFNTDETGLFWKKMPSRTFIAKSMKAASGFKAAKDRITFLLCSNASGARMLNPLLLNKALHPRTLKDINLTELPVHFMANKKAWVTSAVFTTWFNDCFVPEVEKYVTEMGLPFKVLLIVGNAPGHPCLEHPNVQVVFLPHNTTSLIQLLEQGIVATFKKHYVKITFRYILEKLEKDGISLTKVWKKSSISDCINHATAAITQIQQHTLNSCWKAVWPECVINRNVTDNTSTLSSDIIALAHQICGEGLDSFSENDLIEMIEDETVNDSDIIDNFTDHEDGQEEPEYITADKIYAGIQLCSKLEKHFLKIDNNSQRSLKFQKEIRLCISGYRDVYQQLTKRPSSQKLITYMLTKHKSTVVASSDESDYEPVHRKNMRVWNYDE
ncbi:tigger transposable element-derived protein 1-like [Bactrocera oleae]|uniref:tigger transposable element-derived protein 1-like n=1 Tax=Bactrocera oleae TaxID=104688 RepID=UPI00387E3E30